jgi:hypothetical protein
MGADDQDDPAKPEELDEKGLELLTIKLYLLIFMLLMASTTFLW